MGPSLPPPTALPPSGAFPPPGAPPGGGFAPPPAPGRRRGGAGLGLIGGYIGFRLVMGLVSLLVSLGITIAVVFLGLGGRDGGVRIDTPRFQAPPPVTVPADWPETLAPPADAEIVSATVTGDGTSVLRYEVRGEPAARAADIRAQLVGAGFTMVAEPTTTGDTTSMVATSDTQQAVVTLSTVGAPAGAVDVTWTLGPTP